MNPIELGALTVRYGQKTVLDRITLAVPEGSVYALLGRNGTGKSSLVRCLLGGQRPTDGTVTLLGREVWRHRAEILGAVGIVPEEPDVPPAMTAADAERFFSRLYATWNGAAMRERLRRFGVPLAVPFGRLSKGQKGQVSFSLALASEPRLLILDDPTLGLDAVAKKAVFDELIGELADRGTTVFLTTHDLAEVERIADRVAVLQGGVLVLDEEIESLKTRFRRITFPQAAAIPGAAHPALEPLVPLRATRRGWGTEVVVSGFSEERFAPLLAAPGGAQAEVSPLTLEEIFVTMTTEATERAGDDPGEVR